MACTNCKQKGNMKKDFIKSTESINTGVIVFTVVWSLLAIYGIYSLVIKLI